MIFRSRKIIYGFHLEILPVPFVFFKTLFGANEVFFFIFENSKIISGVWFGILTTSLIFFKSPLPLDDFQSKTDRVLSPAKNKTKSKF